MKSKELLKFSFEPVATPHAQILILGSLPGDRSIAENEYYAHPANRFWKVIAGVFDCPLPATYDAKKALLLSKHIALWDTAFSAKRDGSSDSRIVHEIPNNIPAFIQNHLHLQKVIFNGQKAEALYRKYFTPDPALRYTTLPSTSPANAQIQLPQLIETWKKVLLL
ncbi:MAG: DNA-deoxyinosine glycosylase [Bacteroidetes bacterium]|nr:DNA-deoxyinosine glycosylase [Bacteroidota bacterium]